MSKFTPWIMIKHDRPTKIPSRMQGYSFGTNGTDAGIIASYNQTIVQAIATLPELYEALKQIVWKVDQTEGYKTMREDAVIHLAKQALNKVEGK